MLITFALSVLFIAMIVIFAQDIRKVLSVVFAHKSAQIVIPLVLASYLLYIFDDWVLWAIYYYSDALKITVNLLASVLPFQAVAQTTASILVLCLVSIVPVIVLKFIYSKRSYIPFQYPYLTSTILWLVSGMVLLISSTV